MTTDSQRGTTSSTSVSKSTKRYWRRKDEPQSWWPSRWLPLAALVALFVFGAVVTAPDIQAEVRGRVLEQLTGAGVAVSGMTADGQRVTAHASNEGTDKIFLEGLARSTTCETWAGALTCPSEVMLEVDPVEAAPTLATIRPHQFEVVREADSVILRGEVPNAAERERMVSLAGGYFDQVSDQMRISNDTAGAHYAPAADRAITTISHLANGQASWADERLSISGSAIPANVAAARASFEGTGGHGMLGSFNVEALQQTPDARDECNDAFTDALTNASIRFQTASANIDSGNEDLLRRLADLARNCPGALTVEGHTDSRGDAEMNEALSLARARAVRDALAALGIDIERIDAIGYGETRPVSNNDTAEGRARNRRIAISVNESEQ